MTVLFYMSMQKQILAQFNSMNKALNDKDEPLTGALNVGLPPCYSLNLFLLILSWRLALAIPMLNLKFFELGTKTDGRCDVRRHGRNCCSDVTF